MTGRQIIGRPKGTKGKSRKFTSNELDSVIQSLKDSNRNTQIRNIPLIYFNYYLGLKAVHICLLKVSDVFNGKEVSVGLIVSKEKQHITDSLQLLHKQVKAKWKNIERRPVIP